MKLHKEIYLSEFNHPEIDKNKYTSVQIFGIWGLIVNWDQNNFKETPQYMAKQYFEIFMFDYSSQKYVLKTNK